MYSLVAKVLEKKQDHCVVELKCKSQTKAYFDDEKQKSIEAGDFISISGPKVEDGWSICGSCAVRSHEPWMW